VNLIKEIKKEGNQANLQVKNKKEMIGKIAFLQKRISKKKEELEDQILFLLILI